MALVRYLPTQTNFRFMAYNRIIAVITFVYVVGFIGWIALHGLNLGIDFEGGLLMEVQSERAIDLAGVRAAFDSESYGDVSVQHFGADNELLLRLGTEANTDSAAFTQQVQQVLRTQLGDEIVFRRVDYVGSVVGNEMLMDGVYALLLAFAGMVMYIWFRFEWQFALGGLLALMHDTLFILGFYALTGMEFGLTAVAAILTVIGYSINDSVVIFDRVRENMRIHSSRPLHELIDMSLNQTLSRTILTGMTTLLAATALAVFGGAVIEGFAWALVVGVMVGTYSSVYIGSPVLLCFRLSVKAFAEEDAREHMRHPTA
ncbi:MAG: protein translocase subunit SecF [Alphaproteobacteria bacterium]|nr:MAG: protein translocase subunit SecF [Alphaproteobacteria bacterium]